VTVTVVLALTMYVFVIRSVSLLPYNIGSPYLVHILIMVWTCHPDMYHLTLTLFSQSTDFVVVVFFWCWMSWGERYM
jgi:hypothetical protein